MPRKDLIFQRSSLSPLTALFYMWLALHLERIFLPPDKPVFGNRENVGAGSSSSFLGNTLKQEERQGPRAGGVYDEQ